MEKKKVNNREKSMFLDLAERMIRVEQVVSASFHKPCSYHETAFFRNMTSEEQQEFEHYLENKKKQKSLIASLVILPLILLFLLGTTPTGNIIKESLGYSISLLFIILLLLIVSAICIHLLLWFSSKNHLNRKMKEHLPVITDILIKKKQV